jgi:hypothetical protein
MWNIYIVLGIESELQKGLNSDITIFNNISGSMRHSSLEIPHRGSLVHFTYTVDSSLSLFP